MKGQLLFLIAALAPGISGCALTGEKSELPLRSAEKLEASAETEPHTEPNNEQKDLVGKWCDELTPEMRELGWDLDPCDGLEWKTAGRSVKGRELVYGEFGNPNATNTTLVLSMVHSDEITPLYLGLQLAHWLKENAKDLGESRVIIAPLVNPDGFFQRPRTRVNANGVDLNRNFHTHDWDAQAIVKWKKKYRSNPRRFPGEKANSEPETRFQLDLINAVRPQKILSIHAPLNFFDYDGPTTLSLMRFPKEYVAECIKLRKELKAVHFGFYPGSLGNYAGQQMGIPTVTLELPSANAKLADDYWDKFKPGIRTMIEFEVPEHAIREDREMADQVVQNP